MTLPTSSSTASVCCARRKRFGDLFKNAASAVIYSQPDGSIVDANDAALEMFGLTKADVATTKAQDLYADPAERGPAISQLEAVGRRADLEILMRRSNGSTFRASLSSSVYRGDDGEILGYWGIVRDVTDRRAEQARQSMLLRELDHRVRNNLAAITGVARLTAEDAPDLDVFLERFMIRVDAMRIAHEVLSETSWFGAELSGLLDRLLSPCRLHGHRRITINGPSIDLPSRMACPLAMVIAELVTNSVKYGALSSGDGKVMVSWQWTDDGVQLLWLERNGPPVCEEPKEGLGSQLIRGLVTHELGGVFQPHFDPSGFQARISFPLKEAASCAAVLCRPPVQRRAA